MFQSKCLNVKFLKTWLNEKCCFYINNLRNDIYHKLIFTLRDKHDQDLLGEKTYLCNMLILSTSFSFFLFNNSSHPIAHFIVVFNPSFIHFFFSSLNFLFTFFPSCHFPTIFHSFGIFSSSNPVFSPFTSMFFNSFRYHPVTLLSSFPPFPSVFHTLPPVNPPSMVPRINC